ncbi:YicC family protein [bacterium]|nr:YicC family protein [bacterium]
MKSMTGFGRAICQEKGMSLETTIRTLNNRYFQMKVRLSPELCDYEAAIREIVQQSISRGTVELTMKLEYPLTDYSRLGLDHGLAREYIYNLKKLTSTIDIPGLEIDKSIRLDTLLGLDNIWTVKSPELISEDLLSLIKTSLDQALVDVIEMRTNEGQKLQAILIEHFTMIQAELPRIESLANQQHDLVYAMLQKRLAEKFGSVPVDQARLAEEVLYYCERSNVVEEVNRLKFHVQAALELCQTEGPLGRKVEFLIQELFREVNTLGVKAASAEVSARVVELKTLLDQLKEQIQNIE